MILLFLCNPSDCFVTVKVCQGLWLDLSHVCKTFISQLKQLKSNVFWVNWPFNNIIKHHKTIWGSSGLLYRVYVTHQLKHHGHTFPCGGSNVISSIHQTLVALNVKTHSFMIYKSLIRVPMCLFTISWHVSELQPACSLYLMNKVDFSASVEANSDCGSHSSVHTWDTQMTWYVMLDFLTLIWSGISRRLRNPP